MIQWCRLEKKEQAIHRHKQDLELQVAENEVIKAENQNLVQQVEEKISQISILRSHLENLEEALQQKHYETNQKKSRFSGFGANDSYYAPERTPPGSSNFVCLRGS